MKKYTALNYRWKENKALGFFLNYINNHKGPIDDSDAFDLVATLRSHFSSQPFAANSPHE